MRRADPAPFLYPMSSPSVFSVVLFVVTAFVPGIITEGPVIVVGSMIVGVVVWVIGVWISIIRSPAAVIEFPIAAIAVSHCFSTSREQNEGGNKKQNMPFHRASLYCFIR